MARPAPLTPADLDLRKFPYMGLDVVRLRDSNFAVVATGDEFRAGILLWAAAWHQVPAASLPNDNRLLANLAGFGRNVDDWLLVREGALHGFVECDDGRLYHPIVAEKALEAEEKRLAYRARTSKATEARRASIQKRNEYRDVDRDDNRNDSHLVKRDGLEGRRKERKGREGKPSDKIKTSVVVSDELRRTPESSEGTTTTTGGSTKSIEGVSSSRVKNDPMGIPLPEDWVLEEVCIKVAHDHGMTDVDIEGEVFRFHAFNAHYGNVSQNWNNTWSLWCAEFKRRKDAASVAPAPAGESKSETAPYVPTERDWEFAAKYFASSGRWNIALGPEPTSSACKCPPDILAKHGIALAAGYGIGTVRTTQLGAQ